MSKFLDNGLAVLSQAEEDLRGLLSQAAHAGEYESVRILTDWALLLQGLREGRRSPDRRHQGTDQSTARESSVGAESARLAPPLSVEDVEDAISDKPLPNRRHPGGSPRIRSSSGLKEYPKFFREGDHLVKVGWSKGDKTTYEHKAPRRLIEVLVQALKRANRERRRFTVEAFLPFRDPKDGTEFPTYQVYLWMAWLRKESLIVQHGRQGYSLAPLAPIQRIDELIENRFAELRSRSSH